MVYFLTGLRSDNGGGYFFWYLFTLYGVRFTGSAFTQMVATAFASPEVAAAVQSTMFTVFFLFAGFLIPASLISNGWIWMYYLSFIRYPLDFMISNEYAGLTFNGAGAFPDGYTVLNTFGINYDMENRVIDFISLWLFCLGFFTLGFLALKYINHVKR